MFLLLWHFLQFEEIKGAMWGLLSPEYRIHSWFPYQSWTELLSLNYWLRNVKTVDEFRYRNWKNLAHDIFFFWIHKECSINRLLKVTVRNLVLPWHKIVKVTKPDEQCMWNLTSESLLPKFVLKLNRYCCW